MVGDGCSMITLTMMVQSCEVAKPTLSKRFSAVTP